MQHEESSPDSESGDGPAEDGVNDGSASESVRDSPTSGVPAEQTGAEETDLVLSTGVDTTEGGEPESEIRSDEDPTGTLFAEGGGAEATEAVGAADTTEAVETTGTAGAADTTVTHHEAGPVVGEDTVMPAGTSGSAEDTDEGDEGAPKTRRVVFSGKLRAGIVVGAAIVGSLALFYGADLLLTRGDMARGTTVAGVDVGGLDRSAAEQRLRESIEPRMDGPVRIDADGTELTLEPQDVGLDLDWEATLDRASNQSANPFNRAAALFTTDEIGVVSEVDTDGFDAAVEDMAAEVDRDPEEGAVRFDDLSPVPVDPDPGVRLDTDASADLIRQQWVGEPPVSVPVDPVPVRSTPESVRAAVTDFAEPAVSGPVTLYGEDEETTVSPDTIAEALGFRVDDSGALVPDLDETVLDDATAEDLGDTEDSGRDAAFVFEDGDVDVRPSEQGRGIDWEASLPVLTDVLRQEQEREVTLSYGSQPADLTTEEAHGLGIDEVVGEFTTGGFAPDSGINIQRIADEVDGAVVKPGETFSLNGYTGQRGLDEGYIEAEVISEGTPDREVGGGISQFATTLYNAAYFAGMEDTEHKEHSYYIDRYPQGREATVFQNPDGSSVIDLQFTNDSDTGVVIETDWTPSDITVRLWGTKHYDIESITGGRENFQSPSTRELPADQCSPSAGATGFNTSDIRVFRDPDTGDEIRREPRNVHYNPQPQIVCGSGDEADEQASSG